MSIIKKIQMDAIKTKGYMVGRIDDTIMLSNGYIICYIDQEECMIDTAKMREFSMEDMEKFSEEKIRKTMDRIELTNEALIFPEQMLRLFENRNDRIWIDSKYVKMFKDYDYYSAYIEDGTKVILFTDCEKIVGLVLPVKREG